MKKKVTETSSYIAALMVAFVVLKLPDASLKAEDIPADVSMVRLLSNPERYVNKRITVTGFLHYQFEDTCLYLTSEHAKILDMKNGILLHLPSTDVKALEQRIHTKLEKCDGKWVTLMGVFRLEPHPDGQLSAGGLLASVEDLQMRIEIKKKKTGN